MTNQVLCRTITYRKNPATNNCGLADSGFGAKSITAAQDEPARAAELIAARVVGWNLRDRKDEPVAVSVDNVRRLHADAFSRLASIALGMEQPDGILNGEQWDEEAAAKN